MDSPESSLTTWQRLCVLYIDFLTLVVHVISFILTSLFSRLLLLCLCRRLLSLLIVMANSHRPSGQLHVAHLIMLFQVQTLEGVNIAAHMCL